MLDVNDLLSLEGIDPRAVAVILHSPRDRRLRGMLPWIVRTRRAAFEEFQRFHSKTATATLKGRPRMASFVELGDRERGLAFVGLYERVSVTDRPVRDIWADPLHRYLHDNFDYGEDFDRLPPDDARPYFEFRPLDALGELSGRLIIAPRLSRAYVRLAERLDAPVSEIARENVFDAPPPPSREMLLTGPMLRALPESWAARLREWRGIYLIVDESDGARYVGAAYGAENLLGRWRAHVAGNAGITAHLRPRDPAGFRFSILERVSPDLDADDVIALERTWMARLATREHGLNE